MNQALWFRRFGPPDAVLSLERAPLSELPPGFVRVRMSAAPINPSDLIPITGAYAHRIVLPRVAGYEGCGVVVESADSALRGRRVLPLRGDGTWQSNVHVDPRRLIVVPDDVPDDVAARAYINPLAASAMLERHPVAGRRVLLTGGGSSCARLLGAWAKQDDAREVVAVHRSSNRAAFLAAMGVVPVSEEDPRLESFAARAEVVFDAVGGRLAEAVLKAMPRHGDFISYGLLSGRPFLPPANGPMLHRFHLRDRLEGLSDAEWRGAFERLWPRLRALELPRVQRFPLADWRLALAAFDEPGREFKPLLIFDGGSE